MYRRNLMRTLAMLVLVGCLTTTGSGTLRAKSLAKSIRKRGLVMYEDTSFGRRYSSLPFEELLARIRDVRETPLELAFGRTILTKPDGTGIIGGIVTGLLKIKVAMMKEVAPEEGGMDQALVVDTSTEHLANYANWQAYIARRRHTNGTDDLATALLLRRKARILKFQLYVEGRTGKRIENVTDRDIENAGLREDPTYAWLANDIFEPVTILLKPKLQVQGGKNRMQTGPAFAPIPTLNLFESARLNTGESAEGFAVDPDTGRFIVKKTDSVVFIDDIGDIFSIDGSIADDTLGDVVGHELFHGIMYDLMGVDAPGGRKSLSKMGHDAHVVSDRSMALSEGWAEFFEAWSGADNPTFEVNHDKVTRFLLGRQVPIRMNKYVQDKYEKFRTTRKTGRIKNGAQMIATEGLVAGILYKLLTHEDLPDAFDLIMTVMYLDKPQDILELVSAMANRAGDERRRRAVLLTFLYETRFTTVSSEARHLYETYYQARLARLRAMNEGEDDETIQRLEREYEEARENYTSFARQLAERVLAGELPLDANIGPELWMDRQYIFSKKGKTYTQMIRLDLNTATAGQLAVFFGLTEEGAKRIVSARDAKGFFTSVEEISHIAHGVPAGDVRILLEARRAFLSSGGR